MRPIEYNFDQTLPIRRKYSVFGRIHSKTESLKMVSRSPRVGIRTNETDLAGLLPKFGTFDLLYDLWKP